MRRYQSLRGRREFAAVLRRGKSASTKEFSIFVLSAKSLRELPKLGIVATAKVGNAVERNRLRRRCKAILDELGLPSGLRLVVVFRPGAAGLSFDALKEQVTALLAESTLAAGNPGRRREVTL